MSRRAPLVATGLAALSGLVAAQEPAPGLPLGLRLKEGDSFGLRVESDVSLARETRVKGGAPTRSTMALRLRQAVSVTVVAARDRVFDVDVAVSSLAVDADEDALSASFDSTRDDWTRGVSSLVEPFAAVLPLEVRGRLFALDGRAELVEVARRARDRKRTRTPSDAPRDLDLGRALLALVRPEPARAVRRDESWTREERRHEEAGELVLRRETRFTGTEPFRGRRAARLETRTTFAVAPAKDPPEAPPRVLELREGDSTESVLVDVETGRVLRSTLQERLVLGSRLSADVEVVERRKARRTLEDVPPGK